LPRVTASATASTQGEFDCCYFERGAPNYAATVTNILCVLLFEVLARNSRKEQGCQIFLGTTYQNGEKYTKLLPKLPNCHNLNKKAVK
jgi:hypothetical protein